MSRITTLALGTLDYEVDYDLMLKDLKNDSEQVVIETIGGTFYWIVAMQWLDATDAVKDRFWAKFNSNAKNEERMKAIRGNMSVKFSGESNLISRALDISKQMKKTNHFLNSNLQRSSMLYGLQIIKLIESNDHMAFARISKILKNGGVSRGSVGGEGSNYCKYLKAFVECHIEAKFQLPTKKAIRKQLGIPQDADLRRDADKHLDHLGLGGLPPS
jgi:hypothetical protein